MDDPVVPFDLARMFLGEQAPLFYLEVTFRTALIYGYTLLLLRWVGGRTVAQLSMVEFLLVIALGSAVGDSLFYPDVPLLPAMTAITAVVLLNKGLDILILRSHLAKRVVDGMPRQVMTDGRIHARSLEKDALGIDEFLSQLRIQGITNLGEISAAFLEADGKVSLIRRAPRPGLRINPPHEVVPPPPLTGDAHAPGGLACCIRCGANSAAADVLPDRPCPHCGGRDWTRPESVNAPLPD